MVEAALHTERLTLAPTAIADAAFHLDVMNQPKWIANIGDRNVHTVSEAEEYIRVKMHTQYERLGFGNYTIFRKSDGQRIGFVGIYDRKGLEGYDFGFALHPSFEKQGYAYEACKRLLTEAKSNFGIAELSAITIPSNTESQRLLEKLGFRFNKTMTIAGDDEELMLYEVSL